MIGSAPVERPSNVVERRSPSFVQEIIVAREEIDDLGHVSNIEYVRWIQEIAKAHSRAVGWTRERYDERKCVWVVRRHEVEYVWPSYEGERIRLETWVENWRGVSSGRRTLITRAADGREIVRANTLWVLINTVSGKPIRIFQQMHDDFVSAPREDPAPWRALAPTA